MIWTVALPITLAAVAVLLAITAKKPSSHGGKRGGSDGSGEGFAGGSDMSGGFDSGGHCSDGGGGDCGGGD